MWVGVCAQLTIVAATAWLQPGDLTMGGLGAQESVLVFARFRPQDSKEEHSGGEIKAKFTSNESCSCTNDDGNPIGERLNPKPKPYRVHSASFRLPRSM